MISPLGKADGFSISLQGNERNVRQGNVPE
jgi:hypothetical protein